MRAELVRQELEELAGILGDLKLDILEILYTCEECTEHQIFALFETDKDRVRQIL